MTKHVFVYGTLKRGFRNHTILEYDTEFVSDAILKNHTMYYSSNDHGFPVAVADKNSNIVGELYEILDEDVLGDLDDLEAEGFMYERKTLIVHTPTKTVHSYVYIGLPSVWDFDTMTEVDPDNKTKIWNSRR